MQIDIDFKRITHWILPMFSEVALYFLIYYVQYIINVGNPVMIAGEAVNIWGGEINLLLSSFLIWAMLNIALLWCPLLKKESCCKQDYEHHNRPESKGKKPF